MLNLEFGIEGHFRRENLTSFLVTILPRPWREPTTSHTPRLHSKQGIPHPTRSAIEADCVVHGICGAYMYCVVYGLCGVWTVWCMDTTQSIHHTVHTPHSPYIYQYIPSVWFKHILSKNKLDCQQTQSL